MLYADGFGNRDLDMIDVLTIPERLDETVGKPKDHEDERAPGSACAWSDRPRHRR
jgi:hypothetical protein